MGMKNVIIRKSNISSSGSGTAINYGSCYDFLTSCGSGSTSQKVTVPTVPVQQRLFYVLVLCVVINGTFRRISSRFVRPDNWYLLGWYFCG
jgi:hypothetical protein